MMGQASLSFTRYLAAKKTVDDRALNRHVWDTLAAQLPDQSPAEPLHVLEIGAGIGTMVERMVDWGLLRYARYTAIDSQAGNVEHAIRRLAEWARDRGSIQRVPLGDERAEEQSQRGAREKGRGDRGSSNIQKQIAKRQRHTALHDEITVSANGLHVAVELESIDLFGFAPRETGRRKWDLLVAHAFLDLVNVHSTLPMLYSLLKPGGMFYFTIVYDGLTILDPEIDPEFDALVLELYHRTMDERVTDGRPGGDRYSGRHMIDHLRASGAGVLAAGSSDWVVVPGESGYPDDEAYFLYFIVNTIYQALIGHPELEAARFEEWVGKRRAQVERGELVYIAHQMDFLGRGP
jgi:SAM-dependent methyltransferase